MRSYRAKRRDDVALALHHGGSSYAADRIAELEEEVRHLKAELAKRPDQIAPPGFNTRPFTPVPKVRK
jgi:hypothetical protein